MRFINSVLAYSGLLFATVAGGSPADGNHQIPRTELESFVDGVVEDAIRADHLAGVVVAVVDDDAIALLKGYGYSRFDPVTAVDPASTLFRVGSISKTFTWIALMKEVERGSVQLDDPVNDHLPAELRVPDAGFNNPVRLRDLMSHAGGFADGELGFLLVNDPNRLLPMAQFLQRYRPRRVREPGPPASYSNYGATLAGYIVSSLRQQPFETVIETEIVQPLQLRHTTFREPHAIRADLPAPMTSELAAHLASGFDWTGADFAAARPEFLAQTAPAGSASMSGADVARYMLLQLNDGSLDGVTIYSPQTAQAFRTTILPAPPGVNGWAHGFATTALPGGFTGFGHSGATSYFHANMVVVPELRLGIFIAVNTSTGWSITRRFPALLMQHFFAPAATVEHRRGSAELLAVRDRYEGAYLTTRRPYAGLEKLVELLGGTATVTVTSDGYLRTQYGPLDQTWVPDTAPGNFRAVVGDERLIFALDGNGRALSFPLASGNATLERVGVFWTRDAFDLLGWLTVAGAVGVWISFLIARRRWSAKTRWQQLSQFGALLAAALWVFAAVAFDRWLPYWHSGDVLYRFPGFWLASASSMALAATIASTLALLGMLAVWRERRDVASPWWWSTILTISLTTFLAFACLLAAWSALLPWVTR